MKVVPIVASILVHAGLSALAFAPAPPAPKARVKVQIREKPTPAAETPPQTATPPPAPTATRPKAPRQAPSAAAPAATSPPPSAPHDLGLTLSSASALGAGLPVGGAETKTGAGSAEGSGAAGGCTDAIVRAKPIEVPQPEYPESERGSEAAGKVRVQIELDSTGAVRSARVLQSLSPAFDAAALAAVQKARFEPATRCGEAVGSSFVLAIRFEL